MSRNMQSYNAYRGRGAPRGQRSGGGFPRYPREQEREGSRYDYERVEDRQIQPSKPRPKASKNDPLHLEALVPLSLQEGRPIAAEQKVYPTFSALPDVATQLRQYISAIDNRFSSRVPESALQYYCAAVATARMYKVKKLTSGTLTASESAFMEEVFAANLQVPVVLNYYLSGFGDFILNGRDIKVKFKHLNYLVSEEDDSVGWFGRVNHRTHWLYMSYPCLAVYLLKIQMDIVRTANRDLPDHWQLPEDIRPLNHDSGYPTRNLLGYGPANVLTALQSQWLIKAGFNEAGDYTLEMHDMPLMMSLITASQTELRETRCKLVDLIAVKTGSTAQSVTVCTTVGGIAPVVESKTFMLCVYGMEVTGSVVIASKSMRYLQKHAADEKINSWSIYEWDGFSNVPQPWIDTANTLYDSSSAWLKLEMYRTEPFVELRKLAEILHPKE